MKVQLPGSAQFIELTARPAVPARDDDRHAQGPRDDRRRRERQRRTTADFYDGIFKIGQTKGSKPITVLTLVEKLSWREEAGQGQRRGEEKEEAPAVGRRQGPVPTKGKHSAATVVGTKWLVEDRCTSTLTRVKRGKVCVRDFVKRRTSS